MKKLLIILTISAFTSVLPAFAQDVPERPARPDNDARLEEHLGRTPVGTATTLLLGLGAGVLGYKLRKNSKKEE